MRRWRNSDKRRDKISKAGGKRAKSAKRSRSTSRLINHDDSRIVRISGESTGARRFSFARYPAVEIPALHSTQRPRACPGRKGQIDGEKVGAGVRLTLGPSRSLTRQ